MPLILLLAVWFVAHFAWLLAAFGATANTPPRWWLGQPVPGVGAAYRLFN